MLTLHDQICKQTFSDALAEEQAAARIRGPRGVILVRATTMLANVVDDPVAPLCAL